MLDIEKNEKNKEKKKGLGRGLGSLLGGDDLVEGATAKADTLEKNPASTQQTDTEESATNQPRVWNIAIDRIFPNKEQPRKDFVRDKIQELSQSIKEQGIIQPIVVRKTAEKQYEIIAGERRWRAAQHAGLHEVPVIIKEADNKKVLEWALIENIQREDLNPIEEAEAYSQLLKDYNYTHQQLAGRVGKDRATISNTLRTLTLPKEVREMVRTKQLTTGHAKALSSLENPEQLKKLAKQIMTKSLSVRATEREVARLKSEKNSTVEVSTPNSRQAEHLSSEIQKALGTRVKIDYKQGKGKLTIHFYSDDELTIISEKLKRPV